ncbi:MAG: PAS/PAC sensor signal transduction histidine kinase [Candidatus Nomurabacteria bacterium GW2011_GWF2_35_66]|uniref:histidine kinase n=1 Tax=Candidatus Nomurabacteria bacterium GW2011_GWE1_35_16 TaxID=1618761 RepID=A0A0G0EH15_9BACT|nr:MAG: PAS/PAC sensor signal transduction histidine kinase [Candidatus Nomurabacteria bacterium GW2011_GWF1_34_20]KKP63365.1 MAG: PAS/PAC sensor signal transduction histidine kinase [Candidatus Nomurabacteria bacterium GW2011_GWE2_34_25]KKP66557.1 MAG: PAS/PAC sensor signal transduction histidine kinase [Candidatus Nomurabacteria bacterium GW2011_GWE1_35_16]KKP83603.1 MAG: PAS/PAC sensor signal transduction histidine kinase [Candidatus Nomurabacteria bacterium GW2011_GWF2_35_66]HAE36863.1 hypo
METSIQKFIELCQWDPSRFLILSNNVFGSLIYYSHFIALLLALIVGVYVFIVDKKSLVNRLLFFIMIAFSIWVLLDLVLWANEKNYLIMFFWSLILLVEPLIYALSVYFIDVFIEGKDISFKKKVGIFSLLLPIIILLPTKLSLVGFNLMNCYREPIEGFIATYYVYFIEILYIFWIMFFIFKKYKQAKSDNKKQIFFIAFGVILFLLSFASGNIIGSITDNWTLAQIGLFSMPIFAGFIGYMIVRFKTFNVKLLGAEALVFALGFMVTAMLFVRRIENVKGVVIATLVFVIILGYILIKSVKKEVMQREQLQILTEQLFDANEKLKGLDKLKTEFVSLASHQLRSPLTAIKGYTSMLIDGDYGEINKEAKGTIERILESSNNLTKVVEDLLNVSKIESGGMKYEMAPFDLNEIASSMAKDLSITAEKKGLKLNFLSEGAADCIIKGDKEKLRQVVLNFIDNSIKYTKTGEINVKVEKVNNKVIFSVKDTGMGMTPEIKETLFQKFARGDGARMNTSGSGLGLYLTKEIAEAHGGRVYVESEGMGKGSTFFMELNAVK